MHRVTVSHTDALRWFTNPVHWLLFILAADDTHERVGKLLPGTEEAITNGWAEIHLLYDAGNDEMAIIRITEMGHQELERVILDYMRIRSRPTGSSRVQYDLLENL
jgi:hypothetical protein